MGTSMARGKAAHRPADVADEAPPHGDAEEGTVLLDGEGAGVRVQQQTHHVPLLVALLARPVLPAMLPHCAVSREQAPQNSLFV